MDFKQTQQAYIHLKDQLEQGHITADEFESRVNEMIVTDSAGVLWQMGVKTGKWYRYDGQGWVEDTPREFGGIDADFTPLVTPQNVQPYQNQEQPQGNKWVGGLLIGGILAACCVIVVIGGWFIWSYSPSPAPFTPPAASSLTPPSIPQALTPESGNTAFPAFPPDLVQFQDDFSNPGSGWYTYQDSNGSADYSNGSFRIKVTNTSYLLWANPNQSLQNDISIYVDATKAGGPDDNKFGVICRYQDSDNFYYLFITSDGYAGISKFKNNEQIWLTGDALISSDAINQGAATNSIRADCAGSTLILYANNQQIASVTDSSFSDGDVGLIAGTYETPGVDILFDNFMVFKAGY